jgi:hypothetical protein
MNNILSNVSAVIEKYWLFLVSTMLLFNALAIIYLAFGFGTVQLDKPADATIFLEENSKGTVSSLSLRPGLYTLRFGHKDLSTKSYTVRVLPFIGTTIVADKASPIDVLKEAVETPYVGGEYTVTKHAYINDSWLVAKYESTKNNNSTTVVFRFIFGKWYVVVYYPNDNSSESLLSQLNKLPEDILATFNKIRRITNED